MSWGSPVEIERRRRIRLSLAAYSYEMLDNPIMSDGEFDDECKLVDKTMSTGNRLLDDFFLHEFEPDTGQWIHKHPELDKLKALYKRIYERTDP